MVGRWRGGTGNPSEQIEIRKTMWRVFNLKNIVSQSLCLWKSFLLRIKFLYTLLLIPGPVPIYLSVCLSIYLSICLSIYLSTYSPLFYLGRVFSFLILCTVGRTPRTGDQLVARTLPTHRTTQTQNKRTQTYMPRVGFETMIPAFERAKTVNALDRAATVIDPHPFNPSHIRITSTFVLLFSPEDRCSRLLRNFRNDLPCFTKSHLETVTLMAFNDYITPVTRALRAAMQNDVSHGFSWFHPLNSGTFHKIRPLTLIVTLLRIHHSQIPITGLYMLRTTDGVVDEPRLEWIPVTKEGLV
jgi:hypothetical protein